MAKKKNPYAISPSQYGRSWGGHVGAVMGGTYAKNPASQAVLHPPAGIPLDPAAEAAKISAGRNLAVGTIGNTLNQGYLGYDTGYSPTGARDYSNPYSRAALLQESYKRSQLGTTNSYAAQGQLYSGAYGRMQNENARNYSIQNSALQTAAQRGYTGIGLDQLQNAATYGTGLSDATWQALVAALTGGS